MLVALGGTSAVSNCVTAGVNGQLVQTRSSAWCLVSNSRDDRAERLGSSPAPDTRAGDRHSRAAASRASVLWTGDAALDIDAITAARTLRQRSMSADGLPEVCSKQESGPCSPGRARRSVDTPSSQRRLGSYDE